MKTRRNDLMPARLEWLEPRCLFNAGVLDGGFAGGKVSDPSQMAAGGVVVQSDGKVIVAAATANTLELTRYNADGTLDTLYANVGHAILTFGTARTDTVSVGGLALQSDGKVVVAATDTQARTAKAIVARFGTAGRGDRTFGAHGLAIAASGPGAAANSVALQSDGKIVVGGAYSNGATRLFAVERLNTNGSLDSAFGRNGLAAATLTGNDQVNSVAVAPDGDIVAAGMSIFSGGGTEFVVLRLLPNGSADPNFGSGGGLDPIIFDPNNTEFSGARAVAVQSDGKIVVVGIFSTGGNDQGAIARLDAEGNLDPNFNGSGEVITDLTAAAGEAEFNALAIQGDGKILVGGEVTSASGNEDFALGRFTTFGTPDPTFGTLGINSNPGTVTTDFGGEEAINALAIEGVGSNSRIFAAGGSSTALDLAAYINDDGSSAPLPIAAVTSAPSIRRPGSSDELITIQYSGLYAINAGTLTGKNIQITGPNRFRGRTFIQSTARGRHGAILVTYRLPAPAGGWTAANNGTYDISVQANSVEDTAGRFVAAGVIGQFAVSIGQRR